MIDHHVRATAAGDILRTAVAPSVAQIGQFAVIAAIRTALNYFLGREIELERREIERLTPRGDATATGAAP